MAHNINVGTAQVTYTNIYSGTDITGIKADVKVPATDGDVSGYVTLGAVEGWTLSENNTKLSKTYSTNGTEIITIPLISFNGVTFEGATANKGIEIYGINASDYVRAKVLYSLSGKEIVSATVMLEIKEGKNYLFDDKTGWVVSSDRKKMSFNPTTNYNDIDTCIIYPGDQTYTSENEREETFSYSIKQLGLTAGTPIISYAEIKGEDTIATKVSILVPWTLGESSGYATLNSLDGWKLEESNRKLTKTYYENKTENIKIPVYSCNDYVYAGMYEGMENLIIDATINVNQINYKKTVKGISSDSRCLYDTYTKEEIENFKLQLDVRLKELESKITNS